MAVDMVALQAQLLTLVTQRAALWKVYSSGLLRVTYADRTVQYQSTKDMRDALKAADDAIAAVQGQMAPATVVRRPRQILFVGNKGL